MFFDNSTQVQARPVPAAPLSSRAGLRYRSVAGIIQHGASSAPGSARRNGVLEGSWSASRPIAAANFQTHPPENAVLFEASRDAFQRIRTYVDRRTVTPASP